MRSPFPILIGCLSATTGSSAFIITVSAPTRRSDIQQTTNQLSAAAGPPIMLETSCNEKAQETFRGLNVLLTGASGGLGRCLALQLVGCGANALVLSGRNEEALQKLAIDCKSLRSEIQTHVIPCDLSDRRSVKDLAKRTLEVTSGRIDLLINNGGVSSRSRFLDTQLEVDEKVMQINFLAGAALAKMIVPGMVERSFGKILWISSVQGLLGIPNRSSYAASKFAVQGYCEAIRAELSTSGVTVHVASPGYIRTNLSMSAMTGDGGKHGQMDATTAGGADPNEVAVQILEFVAKGKADFIVAATMSAKAAMWLRFLAPGFLNKMLVKRYEKSQKQHDS